MINDEANSWKIKQMNYKEEFLIPVLETFIYKETAFKITISTMGEENCEIASHEIRFLRLIIVFGF